MPQKTLTRADLAAALHKEIGMSDSDCSHLVEEVLENMAYALTNGEDVKISSFGTFSIRQKKERIGRNPKTNEESIISSRKVVVFKAPQKFKGHVAARSK